MLGKIHTGTEIKPMNIKEVIRKKHCRTIPKPYVVRKR